MVKVASLQKSGDVDIIRPSWLLDCVKQNEVDAGLPDLLLPHEPRFACPCFAVIRMIVLTDIQAYVLHNSR